MRAVLPSFTINRHGQVSKSGFYWDKYEWNLVGKNGRAKLKHFAVLLTQWMHGDGLGFITKED